MADQGNIVRRFGWISPSTAKSGAVDIRVYDQEIGESAWEEYNLVVEALGLIRPFVIDYLALEKDCEELCRAEEEIRAEVVKFSDQLQLVGLAVIGSQVIAQRLVSNFLASASAFRDRTRKLLTEKFGRESEAVKLIGAIEHREYDASFAYRLLYNLRNYSQHHSSPLDTISASGERENGEMKVSVKLELLRDVLVKNGVKIQPRVRQELLDQSEKIELIPLAIAYLRSHGEIFLASIEPHKSDLFRYAGYIKLLADKFQIPQNAKPMIFEGFSRDSPNIRTKMHSLAADEMEFLIRMIARLKGFQVPN